MQKKFPSNYSPDRSLDASSSLKDFSMGVDAIVANSNDYYRNGASNSEFEKNFKHRGAPQNQNNTSMAALKDSISTC